jgi:N,N'-diacetylchitobiose transport system permease protein
LTRVRGGLPYLLLLPALVTFLLLLGYPVALVVATSLQHMGLKELMTGTTTWVGLDNFRRSSPTRVHHGHHQDDPVHGGQRRAHDRPGHAGRTPAGAAPAVRPAGPLDRDDPGLGDARPHRQRRVPVAVRQQARRRQLGAQQRRGVRRWLNHSWFDTGLSTFAVITLLIVWQAIPFVAFSLYAGILGIPAELPEAARVDGANERGVFRHVTFPALRPLLMMLVFLSIIWDFKVFTQVWTMRQGGPDGQTITLSIHAYITGVSQSRFGIAAAVSVVMVTLLLVVLIPYIRTMLRTQEDA